MSMDSRDRSYFVLNRVACEAFNKAATGNCGTSVDPDQFTNGSFATPSISNFFIYGGSNQKLMAFIRQYSGLLTVYGMDAMLQSVALIVGVDPASLTAVSYCMGILFMKTMPSIFVNSLLCRMGCVCEIILS